MSTTVPSPKSTAADVNVVALASYPVEAACTRFRIAQYIDALRGSDVQVRLMPFLTSRAFRYLYDPRRWLRTGLSVIAGLAKRLWQIPSIFRADVVFVQRESMLIGPPVLEWLTTRIARRPMVLDLDDATYLDQASVYGRMAHALKWRGKTDRLIDWSSVVICGNTRIEEHVRQRGKSAAVLPTIVDTNLFVPRAGDADGDVPLIGWIGSHSTFQYFESIIPVLEDLRRLVRFRVAIVGSGRQEVSIRGVDVAVRPWRLDEEVRDFQNLDIGVYPLPHDEWAESKSGLKAIEYLSVGIPFVASRVGLVAELGVPGETHFLAETHDEWRDALVRLVGDREARRKMGEAGRAYAVQHYSIRACGAQIAELLRENAGEPAAVRHAPAAAAKAANIDEQVVSGFGDEWRRFDQGALSEAELREMFEAYFRIFPWETLPPNAVGLDVGCGSGRWARLVAPRVGRLVCIDASEEAAAVARQNLASLPNCEVHVASVDAMPVPDQSFDFAYSLGVLHHVPDTAAAIRSCAAKLKPGAPFLVYLYYAFDNRPRWFRLIAHLSEMLRVPLSRAPRKVKYVASQVIAALIYWPFARAARLLRALGWKNVEPMPLSYYRSRSFYVMRNDALDRFGTKLAQRFTRGEVETMLHDAGFENITFSGDPPFWCAVGTKTRGSRPLT